MEKSYNFKESEDRIYRNWEKKGFFNPDNLNLPEDAPAFTIVLPPPNITDKLHLGHSSMLAIEDLLIRYRRMNGYRALWVPGTDHAAIATQNVVEKKLLKEEGLTRHALGRENFLSRVWDFLTGTQSTILRQTRSMGASLDWSREAFTLDKKREESVKRMFVDMYNEGVIYRGERVVNWCPRCASTLADDEVEYKEQTAKLYTFCYSEDFPIAIATTRPETKLGDTAVAVNPKDERYRDHIGRTFRVNFLGTALEIKIIADWHIDMEFGTGALGVTPAHSAVDAKMAEEHGLRTVKVIDEKGRIREGFGDFSGKTTLEAREEIIRRLKDRGLLVKEEEAKNSLSVCYRCDTAIEPLPSKQWFVSVDKKLARLDNKSLKEKAIEVAESGQIKFIPERFTKRYLDWMNGLHDWCISRQIWFGHRIPAWYRKKLKVESEKLKVEEVVENSLFETYVGLEAPEGEGWVQDEDSLDTWFSSGMWTFSTLGWPDNFTEGVKTGDLKRFHPTQVLETGYEIITLWVSRMVIMSLFALGEIPFENVYLHGMVLDKNGKKMSKSKGNGIDPLDMIEKFGTDAVRLSLLIGNTPGNDLRLSEEKIEGSRNLVNKLWNVSRYILTNFEFKISNLEFNYDNLSLSDKWILRELDDTIRVVTDHIEGYNFSLAGEELREFTWNRLADWYIEASKFDNSSEKGKVLWLVLQNLLKLWHPFIPFITEKIWEEMGKENLIIAQWPHFALQASRGAALSTEAERNESDYGNFAVIKNIITAIRNARSENRVEPGRRLKAVIHAGGQLGLICENEALIKGMRTGISEIEAKTSGPKPNKAIFIAAGAMEIYLLGAVDEEKEKKRLKESIERLERLSAMTEKKLSDQNFIERAPAPIIDKEKKRLEEFRAEKKKLENQLEKL